MERLQDAGRVDEGLDHVPAMVGILHDGFVSVFHRTPSASAGTGSRANRSPRLTPGVLWPPGSGVAVAVAALGADTHRNENVVLVRPNRPITGAAQNRRLALSHQIELSSTGVDIRKRS